MANIFIEKFAVTAICQYMMDCKVLVPYIDDNDKTPMWDGDIYIYKSEEINNDNFKGRYPLQIKGTKITEDFAETTSYSVRINDLINYSHEGGCAFFVVQERWDEEEETTKTQIFHNLLSKDDINFLLKDKSDTQNTTTIHLSRVPKKKSEFVAELNRYLDIKLKYQEEADPIESKEDGWKPIQVIPLFEYLESIKENIENIKDEIARKAVQEHIHSLLSIKFYELGWRDKVIAFTRAIIGEFEKNLYLYYQAGFLNVVANFYREFYMVNHAEVHYFKALEIYKSFASANYDKYCPDIAMVYHNLGILHNLNDENEKAEKELSEALKIREELIGLNQDIYLPDYANTLENLGHTYYGYGQVGKASYYHTIALKKRKELADIYPDIYLPALAASYNSLANDHKVLHNDKYAINNYNEALKIRKELAEKNPDKHLPGLANTLLNLGNFHQRNKNFNSARDLFEEALNIRRELAKKNPDKYLPLLADAFETVGEFYNQNKDLNSAKDLYDEVLKIRRVLAEKNHDKYLPLLADALLSIGDFYNQNKDFNSAKELFEESLKINRELAEKNGSLVKPRV